MNLGRTGNGPLDTNALRSNLGYSVGSREPLNKAHSPSAAFGTFKSFSNSLKFSSDLMLTGSLRKQTIRSFRKRPALAEFGTVGQLGTLGLPFGHVFRLNSDSESTAVNRY